MRQGINLVAAAFTLTALSYGLARFAYGLLLPQMRAALSLDVSAAGWIGSGAFIAYCAGIIFTFYYSGKLSSRAIALAAGLAATVGMGLVFMASSGWTLGAGITLAGLSTGLTSPPLAVAVTRQFTGKERPKANAVINAGTAAGIMFSGAAALVASGAWRELYALFTVIGSAVTVWLWFAIPLHTKSDAAEGFRLSMLTRPGVSALCISAFIMGFASTALWTFGADILRSQFGFTDSYISWVWIALGAAGISGSFTGVLTNRFGAGRIHVFALLVMAVAIIGLSAASVSPASGFAAMSLFGAAYIVSSGVYLIQGINLLPDRPDLGLGIPFLMLAIGQSVGTPLFSAALEWIGAIGALALFAVTAGLAMIIRPATQTY